MTNFQTLIVPSQLLIPAVCSGILFLGWILFTYMYLRSRDALHFTMLLLFFFGFVFVFAETMILTTGQWQLDPALGTNAHRVEQLAGAFFMVGIPLLVHSLTELTPRWKTVNRYLIYRRDRDRLLLRRRRLCRSRPVHFAGHAQADVGAPSRPITAAGSRDRSTRCGTG